MEVARMLISWWFLVVTMAVTMAQKILLTIYFHDNGSIFGNHP